MKVLILEDEQARIDQFCQKLEGYELYITKLPDFAISLLKECNFDFIFLDHDLRDVHYAELGLKEGTGQEVAEFLRDNPENNKAAKIYVHSMNFYGAENMVAALKDRKPIRMPFHYLIKTLI